MFVKSAFKHINALHNYDIHLLVQICIFGLKSDYVRTFDVGVCAIIVSYSMFHERLLLNVD